MGSRANCSGDGGVCTGRCEASPTACSYPAGETLCSEPSCADGVAALSAVCVGTGACPALQTQVCAMGCGKTGCEGLCTTNEMCSSEHYCSANVCVPRLSQATACANDRQCQTGRCVDGVCCNRVCAGQCEACDLPATLGTCSPLHIGQPRGARTACLGLGVCAGSCSTGAPECSATSPSYERCNGLDDDCDGLVDNGARCQAGEECVKGACAISSKDCGCGTNGGALGIFGVLALLLATWTQRRR